MTYVDLSRKAGFFAPVALLVLVSFLFSNSTSVYAFEIDVQDSGVDTPIVNEEMTESNDGEAETSIDEEDTVLEIGTTTESSMPEQDEMMLNQEFVLDTESTSTENIPATTTENTENNESSENNENIETVTQFACEIEGHKYDQNGAPLPEWQIGLMKIITQGENTDIWDLANDMTDSDGYYCLEWDGETRELRGDTPTINDLPYDFTYHVYEKLVDGWNFLSIEKGADVSGLVVVDENEIRYDGEYISTQVGEINGYIYADSAYHVDFYNYKDAEIVPVVEEENRGSGSSGTRVGDRNRGGSNPQPKVLGEATSTLPLIAGNQVTLVPTGAPDTGAGGTSNVNTLGLSNILFIGRRF